MKKNFIIILVLDPDEIKRLEYDQVGKYLFANQDILIVSRTSDPKLVRGAKRRNNVEKLA